jgi:hypothetical protein
MPTIDHSDAEHAALLIRRALEEDRFPLVPRLDPLLPALAKFEKAIPDPQPPKAPQAGKRPR